MALPESTFPIDDDGGIIPDWTLGHRVARAREIAGLDQQQLAQAIGVSRPLISKWERDQSEPRPSHLRRIAGVTGVSFGWLVGSVRSRCSSESAQVSVVPVLAGVHQLELFDGAELRPVSRRAELTLARAS